MYSMIDSEFFISCLFFIACIIVLNFWLINLFVAVITNTFHAIRDDTKKSAFGAAAMHPAFDDKNENEGYSSSDGKPVAKTNWLKSIYLPARWCFVFLALASLTVQATRTVHSSPTHLNILDVTELAITLAFDLEIVVRLLAEFPDWRAFFQQPNNVLDLVLALGSSIIQIPSIHQSRVYPWLTIFQLARFYRVVLEVPFMRPLVVR
jgi:voltage-dependent calcium channel